jgi:transposase-like protein
MVIVTEFQCSIQVYVASFETLVFYRPTVCPGCGAAEALIGHGFYVRLALDADHVFELRIKRWYCKSCQHTLSLLPSFLLCYRHYLLAVIQAVVIAQVEERAPWATIRTRVMIGGVPSPRSMKHWCASFAAQAAPWLAEIEHTLAAHDPGTPLLTPLGSGVTAGTRREDLPCLLLAASRYLLAWAQVHLAQARAYGSNDRLRFLWLWGHARGLARLI